ncbi:MULTISPECIES: hypothetical protein [Chryseobacterium]|uniref:Uncharacterized protein n=1 Tax=Chryseobacterium pennae TaxID=2258962 RepID=A0A3D9C4E3_9FLAO|nr:MULTISPECIES: hypothetical protein [Chryseobacterium]MCS4305264.1 hypothetical protein [Chryseobacterium sp. BIGb0232]REC60412.1 hypothetical protein DRF65_21385 [Chryseobacterium pennae]ROS07475.1 hypothetical protein EDF65_4861 [Chryseobacterium nakagawai]
MITLSGIVIYNILDYIDPPVTAEGFRYMPTESLFKSTFFSIIIGAVVFITAIRIQRQRQNK